MKHYTSPKSFRIALERRLKNHADEKSLDLQELRRKVAFERFLCRLCNDNLEISWILKGGYAMELRVDVARATRDIDLLIHKPFSKSNLWEYHDKEVLELLRNHLSVEIEDYFTFTAGNPMHDLENTPYGGARYPIHSLIDGRTFVKFHIDVSSGGSAKDHLEYLSGEDWLAFAGISTKQFPSISSEQQFSEKLHAYTIPRGTRINSRFRDLIDITLLIEQGNIDPERLRRAIDTTFKKRKTHALPENLESPPDFWKEPFAEMAKRCQIDPNIEIQFSKLVTFIKEMEI